jgi:mono/diheme cytochrome c family protein/uncharacterized membrane protein
VKCHGTDGTGSQAPPLQAQIPDFTDATWQRRRTAAQLLASILDGKEPDMPSWRGKISEDEAHALVAYVRTFAPTSAKPKQEAQQELSPINFEKRYRQLEKEHQELQRKFRELSKGSPGPVNSKPSELPHGAAASDQSASPVRPASGPETTPAGRNDGVRPLFQQHCVRCHGADGSGKRVRRPQRNIPNFTDGAWQARRSDAELLASILDGKGQRMEGWRDKITAEQALALVAYVRQLAAHSESPEPKQQEVPTSPESMAQAEPPPGFFEKLIAWLGNLHPPIVHFPIALISAAAMAELLSMLTGKSVFEPAARYCVWFGFLGAVAAGVLGWLAGGFHLGDGSAVLTAHRWLGSSTVICAGLVLALSEGRLWSSRLRLWFRITLFAAAGVVLATGFFGGAVVYGLGHYGWPP